MIPFHVKSASISLAVAYFFIISSIGLFSGLTPFTCCKRALIGGIIVYIAAAFLLRIINRVVIEAMLKSRMDQQNGDLGADRN